jgi:hypothetical protein
VTPDLGSDFDPIVEDETGATGGDLELEERQALRRVDGLSTELADVTEVEYRQLRLERVVLVGVWTEGTAADAEQSLVGWPRSRGPRARGCSTGWSSVGTGPTRDVRRRGRSDSCATSCSPTARTP